MSRMVFDWDLCEHTGVRGWIARGYPEFWAVDRADSIVHDCIEHLPGGIKHGPIADELMALGARWYVRVISGDFATAFYAPETTFGQELALMLRDLDGEGLEPPRNVPEIEDWLPCDDIIEEALQAYQSDADSWSFNLNEEQTRSVLEVMTDWLKVGLNSCQKRFNHANEYQLLCLSQELENALKSVHGDYGDVLKVIVDERELDFKVEVSQRLYA